jgi:hypothetical protein
MRVPSVRTFVIALLLITIGVFNFAVNPIFVSTAVGSSGLQAIACTPTTDDAAQANTSRPEGPIKIRMDNNIEH